MSELISHNKSGKIATIAFNRPQSANGMNPEMMEQFLKSVTNSVEDQNIKVIIVRGKGKFFSAGGDLKYMVDNKDDLSSSLKSLANKLHESISILHSAQKPIIMEVNGIAAGAGFSIAMAGDFVFASESAKFTMAYTAAGLSPDGASSFTLPRLIGTRKTFELMVSNRVLNAHDAKKWGLINEVVKEEELENKVLEFAHSLSKASTPAIASVKKLLQNSFLNTIEEQMELESKEIVKNAVSKYGREGISAFLEKRKANFDF